MIPKIIWQTYETEYDNLPQKAKELSESWKLLNKDWQYRYVSSLGREQFIQKNFEDEWYTIYKSYKIDVMRADLWRYMCLYINGGLYCDLDMLCKKPIESWMDLNAKFVISEEPDLPGYTQMIFASEPNSVFLKNLLDLIKKEYYKNNNYKTLKEEIKNKVGFKILNKSIKNTLKKEKDGFVEIIEEKSKLLHEKSIYHLHAGITDVFGTNYKSWRKEINEDDF